MPRVREVEMEEPVAEVEPSPESSPEPVAELDKPDVIQRRLRREFVSMKKLRHLQGEQELAGDESAEGGKGRLIIKQKGATLSPVPRALGKATGAAVVDDGGDGDDGSEVPRLEREVKQARRTHDVAVEIVRTKKPEEGAEKDWAPQSEGVGWRWVVGTAVGMMVLVIAALGGVQVMSVFRRGEGVRGVPLNDFKVERIELGQAGMLLNESPGALYDEACEVLAGYSGAKTGEEALAWLYQPEQEREAFLKHWQLWESPPYFDRPELIQYGLVTNHLPATLMLWGLREDFAPFQAYFIREGGRLRLDWRATEAFSEIPIADLPSAGKVSGVTVRCLAEAKAFHTMAFPEDRFRSFLLSGSDPEHILWGYVEAGSELDLELRDALTRQVGILEEKQPGQKKRLTLVLETPESRQRENQFLISEMLHIEWATP